MRTRTRVATVISAGAIATALLASPSLASGPGGRSADPGTPSPQTTQAAACDGTGTGVGNGNRAATGNRSDRGGQGVSGPGQGQGRGMGTGAGTGTPMGTGSRADLTDVPSGTLTEDQKADLASIAEDEKLAHDLYVAFADSYSIPVFTKIANAETQHLTAVRVVLDRYDVTDPTLGLPAGTFATAGFQEMYDTQLAAGSVDLAAAYEVGVLIEETDIANLEEVATELDAPDVEQVYSNLLAGSERHLAAFDR